jgi:hypothetical protein
MVASTVQNEALSSFAKGQVQRTVHDSFISANAGECWAKSKQKHVEVPHWIPCFPVPVPEADKPHTDQ